MSTPRRKREIADERVAAMLAQDERRGRCKADGHDYCSADECPCECHEPLRPSERLALRKMLEASNGK